MAILIVGADGSMGQRYEAILRFMNKDYLTREKTYSEIEDKDIDAAVSGIIIATPTDTHAEQIRKYLPYRKPILCEKPIVKDTKELKALFSEIEDAKVPFSMMYQYKVLVPSIAFGETHYDYFRHGNDGLVWDCLQIIGLSKGRTVLREQSPIWDCAINGHRIHIESMDLAYIHAVTGWLKGEKQDLGELVAIHEKTQEMAHDK